MGDINGKLPDRDREFFVQLKPVGGACNLNCQYCYVKPFRPKQTIVMSDEVLKRTIASCALSSSQPTITWHGGEPTMTGVGFFQKAIGFMEEHQNPGTEFRNVLQTNATLIDKGLAEFLNRHKFEVSVSLDGPERIHNTHRLGRRGKDTFDNVMKGIDFLRQAGISPSVICTVTQETLPHAKEVFHFLVNMGFKDIKFSPVFDHLTDSFTIQSDGWFRYIADVFYEWFNLSDHEIHVRELDEVIVWLQKETLSLCSTDQTCLHWVSVDPEGNLYPCEYLRSTHAYGNIMSMELSEIPDTKTYLEFKRAFLGVPDECQSCQFYPLCGNGCPATRVGDGVISTTGLYAYCQERQSLYNLIKESFEAELGFCLE